ncbi:Ribosome biogenesis regulatory-like protein [Oryzias melastigma]|uniref:Ribosome biogenesis regulatory protein n=1 Tax=Oryzias melastigma TaxID=30732 RepID=A0A834F737_ORYME|nr:Ribosome biogenesis regulatory-like protein [Oryzias melastigma]
MAACSVEELLAKAEQEEAEKLKTISVQKELDLDFDVGNLLACDKNRIESRDFKEQKKEDFLRVLARDNTQLLINEIWKLPTERVEEAIVAKLPEPATRLPREKPPPKPKPPTKWEQFAKLKGIQKKKKTNMVWDETAKEWRRRWGYKRANDDTKDWLIEVPQTSDPNEDQFAKRVHAKKERVAKNEFNRLKNIARAQKIKTPGVGLLPRTKQSKDELSRAVSVAKTSTAFRGQVPGPTTQRKAPQERRQEEEVRASHRGLLQREAEAAGAPEGHGQQEAQAGHHQGREQTDERGGQRGGRVQEERTQRGGGREAQGEGGQRKRRQSWRRESRRRREEERETWETLRSSTSCC